MLWQALRPDDHLDHHHLLNRAGFRAQKILSSRQSRKPNGQISTTAIERLERIADLDGLASLVILLQCAINRNDVDEAQHLSLALCRSAIASSPLLISLGIAGPFADYVNGQFLCRAPRQGVSYEMSAHDFLQRAKLSDLIVYLAEGNENCYLTYAQKVDFILDILHGRYDDRLATALAPTQLGKPGLF